MLWFGPLTFDPSVWYPSQVRFLAMKVTWPCHWCTSGMTHVWVSDFSHRPHFDMRALLFIMANIIVRGGVWMHPRFVTLFVDLTWFDIIYCSMTDAGCNPRLSQVRELATPFEEWGHPSYYLIIWEVSPLYDYEDMVTIFGSCSGSWWITDLSFSFLTLYLCLYLCFSNAPYYICSFSLAFVFVYIYLFTGLFKLSRISFPAACFSWKLGCEWRVLGT